MTKNEIAQNNLTMTLIRVDITSTFILNHCQISIISSFSPFSPRFLFFSIFSFYYFRRFSSIAASEIQFPADDRVILYSCVKGTGPISASEFNVSQFDVCQCELKWMRMNNNFSLVPQEKFYHFSQKGNGTFVIKPWKCFIHYPILI